MLNPITIEPERKLRFETSAVWLLDTGGVHRTPETEAN